MESKGLTNKTFKSSYTSNKSLSAKMIQNNSRIRLKIKRSCLKQEDKAPFTPNNLVNEFIVYGLIDTWSRDLNTDFTLKDCLLGSVKLTKNC